MHFCEVTTRSLHSSLTGESCLRKILTTYVKSIIVMCIVHLLRMNKTNARHIKNIKRKHSKQKHLKAVVY